MRDMASALNVDIVKDLRVSDDQRGKLFNVEIDSAIDKQSDGREPGPDQGASRQPPNLR